VGINAALQTTRTEPPIQCVSHALTNKLIEKYLPRLRCVAERDAFRESDDKIHTISDRYACGIQHGCIKGGILPINPEEPLHYTVMSSVAVSYFTLCRHRARKTKPFD